MKAMERSPRIVPGAASAELVAPIRVRTMGWAPSPSTTIATIGLRVMKLDEVGEERLAVVLGVVLLRRSSTSSVRSSSATIARFLASIRRMISPVELALDRIGLAENEGPVA